MATVTRTFIAADGNTLTAAIWNNEFNNLLNALALVDADIASNAAIASSKLAATLTAKNLANNIIADYMDVTDQSGAPTAPSTGITRFFTLTGGLLKTRINAGTVAKISTSFGNIQTYTPSGGGTATIDLSQSNVHHITMPAGNITIALSNENIGQFFIIRILQDSGGSRTVTWFSTIKWSGGSPPTLTTTASKADTFGFEVTSAGNYDGFVVGQNI